MPLLSSDHDGERAGAVAAIGRVLKGANLDWVDLSRHIAAPPEAPFPQAPEHDTPMAMLDQQLIDLVAALRVSGIRFTLRSEEFLESLLERAHRFDVVHLSPKQKRWLEDLALKAKSATP